MPLLDLILDRAVNFIPVLLSLTVHEWAHAWSAWRLGDDTAKMLGRVSLNPLDHIDPVGTLLLPLLGVPFGWAKPVPINPLRFRANISMPLGVLITAAAGPISNLLLAGAGCAILAGLSHLANPDSGHGLDPHAYAAVLQFVQTLVLINVLLALFNLLPISPLDGSRIADAIMPASLRPAWDAFSSLGPVLLAAVVLLPLVLGLSLLAVPLEWEHRLTTWLTGG
jgi:Zn-dependent protease